MRGSRDRFERDRRDLRSNALVKRSIATWVSARANAALAATCALLAACSSRDHRDPEPQPNVLPRDAQQADAVAVAPSMDASMPAPPVVVPAAAAPSLDCIVDPAAQAACSRRQGYSYGPGGATPHGGTQSARHDEPRKVPCTCTTLEQRHDEYMRSRQIPRSPGVPSH